MHVHDRSTTVRSYLGRYDIQAHVLPMSRLRLAPKIGHLESLKRLYGYLSTTKHFAIRYRTKEPNYSHLPVQEHDWSRRGYQKVKEEIPKDIPKLLGVRVISTTFLDANLLHDIVTGKSVTAVLDFINTTPIDWYWKRQATVESNMLLQQKSMQMDNILTEQQVNNNKAKTKQYDYGNLENCELNTEIIYLSLTSILICTICVEIYTKEPPSSCSFMYFWYIVILIQSSLKGIFPFKWGLIGDVVGFFIHPTAG